MFLRDDGNFQQAIELLEKVVDCKDNPIVTAILERYQTQIQEKRGSTARFNVNLSPIPMPSENSVYFLIKRIHD